VVDAFHQNESATKGGKAMKSVVTFLKSSVVLGFALFLLPSLTLAQHYTQTNLVSNTRIAPLNDSNLQNAWGLVSSPTDSPWWVSNNAGGTSTLYSIDATGAAHIVPINPPQRVCKNPQRSQPDSSRLSRWSDV
jgi:hypothetical protein